ncbi:MAG: TonB-dependent receptor [Planctomycetota bacterium]|nr:TonB-dependent receptor [Planctomycetota bacterium]
MRLHALVGLALLTPSLVLAQDSESSPPKEKAALKEVQEKKSEGAEEPSTNLKPVIVSSERGGDRSAFEVPQSVFVLGRERIVSGPMPYSVPDLLRQSPSVHAQATASGQGSPFIRGLTSRRNILMIDGIRINNSVFRAGPNQYTATIDPYLLERAEVISGSRSLLYGSDALGGVIKLESRRPGAPTNTILQTVDSKDPPKNWMRGEFFSRYASADQSTTNRVAFRAQAGSVGLIGGVTYQDFNDYKAGEGLDTLQNTEYSQRSADLKLVIKPDEKSAIIAAFQRTDQRNVPRTHSTLFSESYRGTTIPGDLRRDLDQSRQLTYFQYELYDKGFLDRARFSLSWQRQYENEDRIRTRNRTRRQGFTVDTIGTFLELTSTIVPDMDIVLRYGADYYHDFVDTFRSDTNAAGVTSQRSRGGFADDAQFDLFGLYAMVEAPIGDYVTLNGGLRYEYAHVNADDVDPDPTDNNFLRKIDRSYDGLITSFGITVHAHEYVNLIASISQGFRAPNLDDTTSFNDVQSNALDTPAPELDPETTISVELGVKFEHPKYGNFQFFYYRTYLDEFIARVPTGRVVNGLTEFRRDNFSDGSIEGVEGGGEIFLIQEPLISVYGGFAWTYGRGDTLINGRKEEEPLSRINPAQGRIGLRWRSKDRRFFLEGEAFYVRRQNRLAPNDIGDTQRIPTGGTPGYNIYSVRGGARVAPGIQVTLAVENLFNTDYRVHGSGSNGPGLNVIAGVRGEF